MDSEIPTISAFISMILAACSRSFGKSIDGVFVTFQPRFQRTLLPAEEHLSGVAVYGGSVRRYKEDIDVTGGVSAGYC